MFSLLAINGGKVVLSAFTIPLGFRHHHHLSRLLPCINNIKLIKKSKHLVLCVVKKIRGMLGGGYKKIKWDWVGGQRPGLLEVKDFWGNTKKKRIVVGGWVVRAPWNVSIYGGIYKKIKFSGNERVYCMDSL